jgi:hypothetical protein
MATTPLATDLPTDDALLAGIALAVEAGTMTVFTPEAHTATRDEVLATRTGSLADYSATTDSGGSFAVLGPVPGDEDAVYVQGRVTGLLGMVTRTGTASVRGKGAQVRVRFAFATDTGDRIGTLSFGPASTRHAGGVAPRVLFG